MKAERINQNQIRFTLGAEDLKNRDIKLSELSYGSDKTKALFQDMMNTAQKEFGFDFSAQPIMIEAVPLSSGSIRITITKVHAPEKGEDLIPSITTPLGLGIPSLGASPEEEIPAAAPKAAPLPYNLFGFPDFHTLRETASLIPEDLNLPNRLYLDPQTNRYYIEIGSIRGNNVKVQSTLQTLSEYSDEHRHTPLMAGYMREHTRCLIRSRALQKLRAMV